MVLKKGPWTREEDQKLLDYIERHGHGSWRALPSKAGLERCGKSCRLRWTNYLRPDIKRGKFSSQEEKAIIRLHALLGNRWSSIATHLPKRTDNEIKNYWNTRLKKRLTRMGIDPVTHKPKSFSGGSAQAAVVSHMAQWETARLEAEARLARQSSKLLQPLHHKTTSPPPPPPLLQAAPPCLDVLKIWRATSSHNSFFGSAGFLEPPTSTLNISISRSLSVPTILGVVNDVVVANKGKMEIPGQDDVAVSCAVDYGGDMRGSTDHMLVNFDGCDNPTGTVCGGDFEENKNYWNELLNLVNSPVESPAF